MKNKSPKELADMFDHPCKQTCSGWKQGYEKGYAAAELKAQKLVSAIERVYPHIESVNLEKGGVIISTDEILEQALAEYKESGSI